MRRSRIGKGGALFFLVTLMSILCGMTAFAGVQTVTLKGVHDYSMAAEVLELVNQERAREGIAPLVTNPQLQADAMQRASEIAVYYSHTRPDNSECKTAISISYSSWGENIAYGYATAEAVMNGWMNSSGHRENILRERFASMGVGCFVQNGRTFWVQLFTNNTTSGTVPTGRKEVMSWVDAEESNLYLYAARRDSSFCYGAPIYINEGETTDVVVYNLNKGATGTLPIAVDADSFWWRSLNPYSDYFEYETDDTGNYFTVTGIKSNEAKGQSMSMEFGIGSSHFFTNVEVRHVHTPGPAATCTTDQICTGCKEVLAKATGHRQSHYYTCEKDITCTKCNTVLEKMTGHKIQEPTCTEDGYCTICRKKFGNKLYHTYPPRDCLKPLYCSRCGYQRYKAYESHNWEKWTYFYQSATIFSPALYRQDCISCAEYRLIEQGEKKSAVLKVNLSNVKLKKNQKFVGLKVTQMSSGDSVVSVKSDTSSVVEVDDFTEKGKISLTAKKTGTAKIKIETKAGEKKTIKVTVQKSAVKTTKITNVKKSLTLKAGKTKALKPVLKPIYSSQKLTYKSSNKRVASVNASGIIKAKKKGTATITVKSGSVTVTCRVKVK